MRFVCFVVLLTAILSEAKLNIWYDFFSLQQAMIDFIFPKDPDIVRVRNVEQARATNKVTTLDFVSAIFLLDFHSVKQIITRTLKNWISLRLGRFNHGIVLQNFTII